MVYKTHLFRVCETPDPELPGVVLKIKHCFDSNVVFSTLVFIFSRGFFFMYHVITAEKICKYVRNLLSRMWYLLPRFMNV